MKVREAIFGEAGKSLEVKAPGGCTTKLQASLTISGLALPFRLCALLWLHYGL